MMSIADRAMPWKKQRNSGPRSKAGCLTCRQRHVKCDEARPACLRCRKANFNCQFGPKKPLDLSASTISTAVTENPMEIRSLEFFYRRTSPIIQGYLDSSFWNSLVLQVSQSEPCVLHGIIALGSLHEHFGNRDMSLPNDAQSLIEGDFAVEQYSKAVRHLRASIASGRENAVHLSLISAILFICFDNLNGDIEKASTHLRGALSILRERQELQSDVIKEQIGDVADILTRFDIQTSSYIDIRDYAVVVKPLEPLPVTFIDLNDAARSLINSLNYVLNMDRSNDYYRAFRSSKKDEMQTTYFAYSSILASRFRQWSGKYDAILARSINSMTSKELRGSFLLKIYQAIGTILITVCQNSSNETAYDLCLEDFEKILKLSESLTAAQHEDSALGNTPFFCEMGLICPLGVTAIKCRDPSIRRKALSILSRAPQREGPWDRDVAIKVGERVIEIEEDGLDKITTAADVPTTQRVHGVRNWVERGARAIHLSCVMKSWEEDDNEGYYIREELIE